MGRGVAVVVMLVGVGLFGFLAASLASLLLERGQSDEPESSSELREVLNRLERIERRLESAGADPVEKTREP